MNNFRKGFQASAECNQAVRKVEQSMSNLNVNVGAAYFNQRLDAAKATRPQPEPAEVPVTYEDGLAEFKRDFDTATTPRTPAAKLSLLGQFLQMQDTSPVGKLKHTADGCRLEMFKHGYLGIGLGTPVVTYLYNRENETVCVQKSEVRTSSDFPGAQYLSTSSHSEAYTLDLKTQTVSDYHAGPEMLKFPSYRHSVDTGIKHEKMLILDDKDPGEFKGSLNIDLNRHYRDDVGDHEIGHGILEHTWPGETLHGRAAMEQLFPREPWRTDGLVRHEKTAD